jgi:hypothetical protein
VSSTLEQVDWNAELVRGGLSKAVQQLKRESGKGLLVGGVKLALALTELGLIDVETGGSRRSLKDMKAAPFEFRR